MIALDVRALHVQAADGTWLLRGIDLAIEAGERVLLVGASGSGKSTLLRTIAGLEPSPGAEVSGSVLLAGRQVVGRDLDDPPLDVGWLPQDPAAEVCLPVVEDDVAFGCENRGMPVPRIEVAVAAALGAVDALQLRARDTGTLSSGQAQRIGLAAGLTPSPALLLLDEPTAMLDPVSLRAVRQVVLAADGGAARRADGAPAPAVLLVEHRLDEWEDAGGLPDRVVVLAGGRVVADGPAARVWPAHAAALAADGCHLPWSVVSSLPKPAQPEPAEPAEPAVPAVPLPPPPPAEFARHRRARHVHLTNSPAGSELGGTGAGLVEGEGLAVGRGGTPVLSGLSLRVRAGEVVAVVGPNGIGKSTLLLTLAGLLPPLAGALTHPGGRPALVFARPEQQFLAPTVRAELAHDGADAGAVTTMLRSLRLEYAADRSVHLLSGGEQRRLAVGTVLLGGRRAVLADEPTFGLDRHGVDWTTAALRAAARQGRGVVVSSHDLRFVATVADRVLVLADGGVRTVGPTASVLDALARDGMPLPSAVRERVRCA